MGDRRADAAGMGHPAGVEYGPVGLALPPGLSYERWEAIGRALWAIEWARSWWLGDWLLYGERAFGEPHAQAEALAGFEYATLSAAGWVARQIPPERRWRALSFAHHRTVAALEPAEQERWLTEAARAGWSPQELWAALRAAPTPLDDLRRDWERATSEERAAFLAEVRSSPAH